MLGTELDAITQAQLDRGYRVMEILKQDESQPYSLSDQVISIFAVTRGMMDKIPVAECRRFEQDLLRHMHDLHPEFGRSISEKKIIENEKDLEKVIQDFADRYGAGTAAADRARKTA